MSSRTRRILLGGAVLTAIFGLGAQDPELPMTSTGELRERASLVWREPGDVISIVLKVWDPKPELRREFSWTTSAPASLLDGNDGSGITGSGRLVWREKGAADYDKTAIHTIYEGELERGRPHGQGVEIRPDGSRYSGAWRDGLAHGSGELLLSNGDEYEGEFRDGVFNGLGRYAATNGKVWAGRFENGAYVREQQRLVLGGSTVDLPKPVESTALDPGIEDSPPKEFVHASQLSAPNVDYRVYTHRQRYLSEAPECLTCLTYDHRIRAEKVLISPANRVVMNAWKREGRIDSSSLDITSEWKIWPVFLVGDVTNNSTTTLSVERAYLDIDYSMVDLTPFPLVTSDFTLGGNIVIDNYGWGTIENARTEVRFSRAGQSASGRSGPVEIDLGSFKDYRGFPVFPVLQKVGVATQRLSMWETPCRSVSQVPSCIQEIAASGIFGAIADNLYASQELAVTDMVGVLSYEWVDALEKRHSRNAPFRVTIPVYGFTVPDAAEEGSPDAVAYSGRRLILPLNRANYRLSFDLPADARVLQPQQNRRFALTLDSEKSAFHRFRVVLQLSDGRTIESPQVVLNILQWRTEKEYRGKSGFSKKDHREY